MKHKISIGIPTYNACGRVSDCLASINLYTPMNDYDVKMVVLDDGTPDKNEVNQLQEVCDLYKVPLIKHEKNEGIPKSWNDLVKYYDTEYCILLNDDIQINSNIWLKNLLYFMENNDKIGSVGFPIIQMDPNTNSRNKSYDLPNENSEPARVGASIGCCFGVRRSVFDKIIQPDNSNGFWESLFSFFEETDYGIELYKHGFQAFMLPTPALYHCGSVTFSKNIELSTRKIIDYLPMEKYIEILSRNADKLSIPIERHAELARKYNLAYRMNYSRVMYALKHECVEIDSLEPQVITHRKYVDNAEKLNIKWIDINGDKKEKLNI